MNPQGNSNQGFKLSSLVSSDLIRVVVIVAVAASLIYLISSHSDCWFSIGCHPSDGTGYELSTIIVGFLTTLALTSVFGVSIAPAAAIGVLAWLVLRYWL